MAEWICLMILTFAPAPGLVVGPGLVVLGAVVDAAQVLVVLREVQHRVNPLLMLSLK